MREQGFGISLRSVYSVRERGSFVVLGSHHFQRGTYSQRSKRGDSLDFLKTLNSIGLSYLFGFQLWLDQASRLTLTIFLSTGPSTKIEPVAPLT